MYANSGTDIIRWNWQRAETKQKIKCGKNENKAIIIIITIKWLFYRVSTFRWCRIRVTKHMRFACIVCAFSVWSRGWGEWMCCSCVPNWHNKSFYNFRSFKCPNKWVFSFFFLFWRLTTFGSPLPFLFTHARLCKMSAQHTEMCVWQTKFKYSDLCVTLNSNKKIIYIVVWSIFSFFVALVLDRQTTAIILICFSSSSFIHCMAGKCLLTGDIF